MVAPAGSAHIQGCLHSRIIKNPSNKDECLNDFECATLALSSGHIKLYFEPLNFMIPEGKVKY